MIAVAGASAAEEEPLIQWLAISKQTLRFVVEDVRRVSRVQNFVRPPFAWDMVGAILAELTNALQRS